MDARTRALLIVRKFAIIKLQERIEFKQVHDQFDPCWCWTSYGDGRYGHVWFAGYRFKAHVLSMIVFRGKIARKGEVVHHRCDNPRCIHPGHLKVVQQSSNVKFWHMSRRRDE